MKNRGATIAQLLIAEWVVKTAMAFEFTRRDTTFYSPGDRRHLFTWRLPPPDTFVWIGRNVNSHFPFVEKHDLSNAKPTNLLSEGSVTTFAFGHLCLQALTVRCIPGGEREGFIVDPKRGQWDRLLIQVWPPIEQVIRWPPSLYFDPSMESLNNLAARFGGSARIVN